MWPFTTHSTGWGKPRGVVALVGERRVPCTAYAAGRVRALEVDGPPGWWVEGDGWPGSSLRDPGEPSREWRSPGSVKAPTPATRDPALSVSRRRGEWTIRWPDGVTLALRAVTAREFDDAIRVKASLIVEDGVGPCFEVDSDVVGRARLEVRALGRDVSSVHEVILGAGPELILPGTLADVEGVEAFALYSGGRELARVTPRTPAASFSAEGWFDASPAFDWSDAAERELAGRLGLLTTGGTSPASADRPPPGPR